MIEILMPRLSDSMEDGVILTWLAAAGDQVNAGDELVEIETDKATMTYEAEVSGVLELLVAEGETVRIGEPIARVGSAEELTGAGDGAGPPEDPATALPDSAPAEAPPEVASEPEPAAAAGLLSTPLARRVASAHGISLPDLSGSGPRGRITKADVLRAAGIETTPQPKAAPVPSPAAGPGTASVTVTAKGGSRVVEPTRLQGTIARRMAEAKATVPHFQVETEVAMDAAIRLREELKETEEAGPAPSFNDMIVKACGLALRRHPRANGSYRDSSFHLHESVNVGVAVAADDALVVPTVFDADSKSLVQIASETRALADRVRAQAITPPELAGGTFTVSNLGMFGMTAITPVVNPPQAAILGVGTVRHELARDRRGGIVDAARMTLTLSCDHRILYGADAARFLSEIRALLEHPLRLAL